MPILSAIIAYPTFSTEKSMVSGYLALKGLVIGTARLLERRFHEISHGVLLTSLVKVLPAQSRQHVQLSTAETSSFRDVRTRILAYERVSTSRSRDRVLQDSFIAITLPERLLATEGTNIGTELL